MGPCANLDDFKKSLLPMVGIGLCFLGRAAHTLVAILTAVLAPTCMVNDVTILVLLTDPVCVVAYDTELNGSLTVCFRSR
jgi:hypothetical protein